MGVEWTICGTQKHYLDLPGTPCLIVTVNEYRQQILDIKGIVAKDSNSSIMKGFLYLGLLFTGQYIMELTHNSYNYIFFNVLLTRRCGFSSLTLSHPSSSSYPPKKLYYNFSFSVLNVYTIRTIKITMMTDPNNVF